MKELYNKLTLYIHPGSLAIVIGFDLLWSGVEGLATLTGLEFFLGGFLSAVIFVVCFSTVTLFQRYGSLDEWQTALTKGLIFGILSAIPLSFISVGVAMFWGFMRLTTGVDQEVILLGKMTKTWREIDVFLHRLAPPEMRGSDLKDVINYLRDKHLISSTLAEQLHELRRQRNVNIHEMTTDELTILVDNMQAMQITLRTRFLNVA